jgi:hypothetical protein
LDGNKTVVSGLIGFRSGSRGDLLAGKGFFLARFFLPGFYGLVLKLRAAISATNSQRFRRLGRMFQ